MSEYSVKAAIRRPVEELIEQQIAMLVTGVGMPHDQMSYTQGVIAGLRMALDTQFEVFRQMGQ